MKRIELPCLYPISSVSSQAVISNKRELLIEKVTCACVNMEKTSPKGWEAAQAVEVGESQEGGQISNHSTMGYKERVMQHKPD